MELQHISDFDLQTHIEGNPLTNLQQLHLNSCPSCAEKLLVYQQLFVGLKHLPQPVLTFDLAEAVLSKMTISNTSESKLNPYVENIWVIATFLSLFCSIGLAWYFGYLKEVPILVSSIITFIPMLIAILGTVLFFQWIEYRFWSQKILKT